MSAFTIKYFTRINKRYFKVVELSRHFLFGTVILSFDEKPAIIENPALSKAEFYSH